MPPNQQPTAVNTSAAPASPKSGFGVFIGAAALIVACGIGAYFLWFYTPSSPADNLTAAPKKIGVLSFRQFNDVAAGFKDELQKLGYTNITYVDILSIPGPSMMADIDRDVRKIILDDDVNAIWASLEMQAKVAVDVTKELGRTDIPIVFMTRFHDPVESGIIESFRSSGNNSTGVATNLNEIVQRSLEFFREIDPDFKKLGVFSDGFIVTDIGGEYYKELKKQAPLFGYDLVEFKTSVPPPEAETEFNRIAATIKKGDIDGLFHIAGHYYGTQETGEGELAIRLGIPMVAPFEDLPNGGLFSYSDDFGESGRHSAKTLDEIFKGKNPSEIPTEYGANNILTLMMGRAREAGVVFPESMLFIAKNKFEDNSAFEAESLTH